MPKDPNPPWPNPDELRKDMEEFLAQKYGNRVQLGVLVDKSSTARSDHAETGNTNLKFIFFQIQTSH